MKISGRKICGQSFAELAAGLFVLIPIFFLLLDGAVCIIAVMTNDSCARDAARAASAGVPQDFTYAPDPTTGQSKTVSGDALKRAQSVVTRVYSSGGYIVGPSLVGAGAANDPDTGPQPAADGTAFAAPDPQAGGPWIGNYRVTTEIKVNLPAYIPNITPKQVVFHSRQEFPITRTEQAPSN